MPAKAVWIVVGDIHENLSRLPGIPELAEARGIIVNGDFTNYGGPGRLEQIVASLEAALTANSDICVSGASRREAL